MPPTAIVVKKGFTKGKDSYSAFDGHLALQPHPFDTSDPLAKLEKQPALGELLDTVGTDRLFVMGIATDYCVLNSVLDALGRHPAKPGRLAHLDQVPR